MTSPHCRFGVAVAAAFLAIVAVLAPGGGRAEAASDGTLLAGVGTADLTPPVGTPMFAYTAREAVFSGVTPFLTQETFDTNFYAKTFLATVGVHTRLRSRALVLDDGGTRLALVAVDLGGFPYDVHQAVVRRLRSAGAGIDATHLLISATHTHGGAGPIWPLTHTAYGILGGDLFDPRVFGRVADGIAASVLDAVATLEPARVGVAQVPVLDATNNRNLEPYRRDRDVEPSDRPDGKPGSISPNLTAVRADTAAGRPLGLWTTFAIHGTAFGDGMLHFTGDNQAYAERIVEDEIRRRAGLGPEDLVVHALANGAEGDISPRTAPPFLDDVPMALPATSNDGREPSAFVVGDYAGAEVAGERVARGALAAWEQAGRTLSDDVELGARSFLLPLDGTTVIDGDPVGLTVALGCAGVACPDGMGLPGGLDLPGQGGKLPLALGLPGTLVPPFAPLSVVRIGGLLLGAAPFEVTKQMGARVEAAMGAETDAEHVALVGLANGYASYMATPEEYDAHHYEGSFTLYGRQQGPAVQAGLVRLARALETGAPNPRGSTALPFVDLSLPDLPPLLPEPDVGMVLAEPAATVARFGQARFEWVGGDPAADDPHVRLERLGASDQWETVATDDGFEDIVTHSRPLGAPRHRWTETWEATACSATGTHRFVVDGASSRGGPYSVTSAPFEVAAAAAPAAGPITIDAATGVAWFRATYPEPDRTTLRLRPRFASGGTATAVVDGAEVEARWSDANQRYELTPGTTMAVTNVADGCGNGALAVVAPTEPQAPSAPDAPAAPPSSIPTTGSEPSVPLLTAAVLLALALLSRGRSRRPARS
jgi:neutral ceramidase